MGSISAPFATGAAGRGSSTAAADIMVIAHWRGSPVSVRGEPDGWKPEPEPEPSRNPHPTLSAADSYSYATRTMQVLPGSINQILNLLGPRHGPRPLKYAY